MTIQVTSEGRILVDFIQHGIHYSTVALANQEATKLHETTYPHAKLILYEIPETAAYVETPKSDKKATKRARKPMVNSYATFMQRGCHNLQDALIKANAAGRIVGHATLLIESIGARVTNWHTGYNLLIAEEATADIIASLPWFVEVTNEDVSNRLARKGYKLTKKSEVSQIMAALGAWDAYANAVETVKAFEDKHDIAAKHKEHGRISNATERKTVEVPLRDMQDAILESLRNEIAKHLNVSDNAAELIAIAVEYAYEAGVKGESLPQSEMDAAEELLAA
jgi:hypothetical protein